MTSRQDGGPRIPMQVQHVRQALLRDYKGLIYEEDLRGYQGSAWEQRFLSRALAASAVRRVTGCDYETAGRAVTDGENDQGIDAVAVDDASSHVWLVQAKWSDAGRAKMDLGEVLKFIEGLRLIERREFEGPFNDRFAPFKMRLDAAMSDPRLQITLVVALGPVSKCAQPLVDGGDVEGGFVSGGELVVAGGHGSVVFELVDAAFDGVTLSVEGGVEAGWPAAFGAFGAAVGVLVGFAGDGGLDATAAQVGAVGGRGVGLVGEHPVGSGPGPSAAPVRQAWHLDGGHDRDEMRAVGALPAGHEHRQHFAALFAGQVHFGRPPAAGAAEGVIGRFGTHATGWFLLPIREPTCSGGVQMRPGDGGVHTDIPGHQPGRVSMRL